MCYSEYVQFRFQTTTVMAGVSYIQIVKADIQVYYQYQSSLTQVVPIVVAPVMGFIIHRYGYRVTSRK